MIVPLETVKDWGYSPSVCLDIERAYPNGLPLTIEAFDHFYGRKGEIDLVGGFIQMLRYKDLCDFVAYTFRTRMPALARLFERLGMTEHVIAMGEVPVRSSHDSIYQSIATLGAAWDHVESLYRKMLHHSLDIEDGIFRIVLAAKDATNDTALCCYRISANIAIEVADNAASTVATARDYKAVSYNAALKEAKREQALWIIGCLKARGEEYK